MASVITCIVLEGIMIHEISQRKISIIYGLTYMWNLKKSYKTHTQKSHSYRLAVARDRGKRVVKMGKGGQKANFQLFYLLQS